MKTLKLNMLEKSEMNAVRGGDFFCAQYCMTKCKIYKGGDDKASPKVDVLQFSRHKCALSNRKAV